ncbi:MAG: hypothetical protein KAT70_09970 [Thermoplasmata archaeon]|nr:hypothetical protein [Thermoplasmata archaeon]
MDPKKMLSLVFVGVAMALLIVSFLVPWATLDGTLGLEVVGVEIDVEMDGKFYPQGLDFEATGSTGGGVSVGGGIGGGLLGGMGNGTTLELNESMYYYEGLERISSIVGGPLGILLYKIQDPTNYSINVITQATGSCMLDVKLDRETPIWWPVGVEENFVLTISARGMTNMEEVRITEVQFYLYTDYNESKTYGIDFDLVPFDTKQAFDPMSLDIIFDETGDSWTYNFPVNIADFHGRFGIGVGVTYSAEDTAGGIATGDSYGDSGGYPWANQQVQVTQAQTVRVALLAFTMPLLIASLVLGAVGILLSLKKHAKARHILLVVSILPLLSAIFFFAGPGVVLDLIPLAKPLFHWTPFIFLPVAASALLFIGCALEWKEEEEEMVSFEVEEDESGEAMLAECPMCGVEIRMSTKVCPGCGQEFDTGDEEMGGDKPSEEKQVSEEESSPEDVIEKEPPPEKDANKSEDIPPNGIPSKEGKEGAEGWTEEK